MPQIAQQDYIYIDIKNVAEPTAEEKALIRKHIGNGTIFDCVICSIYGSDDMISKSKVLAVTPEEEFITVIHPNGEQLYFIYYSED